MRIERRLALKQLQISRGKTLAYAAIWMSAAVVGLLAVTYARFIASMQHLFFDVFREHAVATSVAAPLFFVLASWLVRRFAPEAKGSGIPQVMAAIEQAKTEPGTEDAWRSPLISLKTAAIKVISSCVGILGGASIGREGPTVQIAASGFAWIGHRVRRFAPQIEFQSFIIAGAAAGVAAAFNTPIAGITFAIEEIAENSFGAFKQIVMLAIIVSGLVAQGMAGDYLYFGHPQVLDVGVGPLIGESIAIGLIGGLAGGLFALLLAKPSLAKLPQHWLRRALITGIVCSAIGYLTAGDTSGSGYEATERILNHGSMGDIQIGFPILKLGTTVLSYLSGMAGGIFSPSLSIGAGLGLSLAKLFGWVNFKACALTGMVAFFAGTVGAPLTGVIIVMEMTDERALVIPFMIAAYIAFSVGRRLMPVPLYHYLAERHMKA